MLIDVPSGLQVYNSANGGCGWDLVVSSLFLGGSLLAQLAHVASSCSLAFLSFYNARDVGGSFYFFWNRLNRT